jgi:hypothetical protein
VLAGSHVRGEALPDSDVDLYCIGAGPEYTLFRRRDQLVSLSWRTSEAVRAAYRSPQDAGSTVPGWRDALLVADPNGIAAQLQREARAWTWDVIGTQRLDAWVAEELCGYAEEVHKLATNRAAGRTHALAVQRSVLALRLAGIMAVRHRILYDTENRLWDLVDDRMGADWRRAQSAALGERGERLAESCAASLRLFALAARDVWPLFDERQRAVVAHACRIARQPLDAA